MKCSNGGFNGGSNGCPTDVPTKNPERPFIIKCLEIDANKHLSRELIDAINNGRFPGE
jgi:hypothetical protein